MEVIGVDGPEEATSVSLIHNVLGLEPVVLFKVFNFGYFRTQAMMFSFYQNINGYVLYEAFYP